MALVHYHAGQQRAIATIVESPWDLKGGELLETARSRREANTYSSDSYEDFKKRLSADGGWYLVPWADNAENEAAIKAETKATIRCYPLDAQDQVNGKVCFYSGQPATHMALFARAY